MIKVLILLKSLKTNRLFFALLAVSFIAGLFFIKKEPFIPRFESPLPSPSARVSTLGKFASEEVAHSYNIAQSFLFEKSLSPTLFGFKKALMQSTDQFDQAAASYGLIYTYFLAKKWAQLKNLYSSGILSHISQEAPYYKDALYMFFIAFNEEKVPLLLNEFKNFLKQDPLTKERLDHYDAILSLKLDNTPYERTYQTFQSYQKSATLAGFLNLLLPGSGYAYLYQWKSALTAFLLLSFLIFAIYSACKNKHYALSFLLFSIFTGFYWGSLVGVAQSSMHYNQTIYHALFDPLMKQNLLYPELWIKHAP